MMLRQLTALLLLGLLPGCPKAEPPRELRLELPDVITAKDPVMVHARAVAQNGVAEELKGEQPYQVTPPELATLGKGGMLTCRSSGDGALTLVVSGVTGRAKLVCKLAAKLEAPERITLDLAKGEVDLPAKVLDAAGKELDLPISVNSDLAAVALGRSGRLVPGKVGMAKLSLRAGQLTKQVEVEVVRTVTPEVLPIDQNRRISYSLDAGKYRLSMLLAAPHRVVVDWLGAPYCAYRGNGSEHRVDCTLQYKGSVSFDNPAFLLRGEKTPSVEGVTLSEVP